MRGRHPPRSAARLERVVEKETVAKPIFRIKSTGQLGIDEGFTLRTDADGNQLKQRQIKVLNENYELTGPTILVDESDLEVFQKG